MWRKAKVALGLNLCVFEPRTQDEEEVLQLGTGRTSDASAVMASGASVMTAGDGSDSGILSLIPTASTPTSSCLRLSKSGSRSYKVRFVFFFLFFLCAVDGDLPVVVQG